MNWNQFILGICEFQKSWLADFFFIRYFGQARLFIYQNDSVIGTHLSYYGPVAQNAKQQQQKQKHHIGSNQEMKNNIIIR